MKNILKISTLILVVLLELIFIITVIISLQSNDWKNLRLSVFAALFIISPYLIVYYANKRKIIIPRSFSLVSILFIFASQYLGEIHGFYYKFIWWDLLLHAFSGGYFVIVSMHLTQGVFIKNHDTSIKRFTIFRILFAFCFSITLGTLWEIFEYAGDYFFHVNMIKGGLNDTLFDLVSKISAATLISIFFYFKTKKALN